MSEWQLWKNAHGGHMKDTLHYRTTARIDYCGFRAIETVNGTVIYT